jgi:histidinol-phosphate/aromatic aminotransferase/cobyric acid decarboxylase-like protein
MTVPSGDHGGDGARLARQLGVEPGAVLDLSASLNPLAPDVAALVASVAESVRRYPDPEAAVDALAAAIGVEPERVVITNGGAEAISLVASVCPTGRVDDPEFSLYARHLRHLSDDGPRWRSNPHNPTGVLAGPGELAAVWDEAFFPLATGCWTRGDVHGVVVGSLTKVFACPGLRAGYVLAPDAAFAEHLRERQPEWSVNSLACEVLPTLLAEADLPAWAVGIAALRGQLVELLAAAGLRADRSDANFVLVRDAAGLRNQFAGHAVLVRDTASFGMPGGVRIAVPDAPGLERVALALEDRRC